MSEPTIEEAVAILERVKKLLYAHTEKGSIYYLCICGALYKLNRKERIPDTFMLQVLETINLDLIRVSRMQGKKSVAYLFPLNYDGYLERVRYLDNIIKNIHVYI